MVAATLSCAQGPMRDNGGGVMSLWRQPFSHSAGGEPVRSQAKRTLCKESIWPLEMYDMGSVCGWRFPKRRCNVVHIAMVPQDQFSRGVSCWIAMRGSCRYGGRGGPGTFRTRNDCRKALFRFACIRVGGRGISMRGSINDQ